MLWHSKSGISKCLTSLDISFLSLIFPCTVCLKENECKEQQKAKKNQNALHMITSVYTRRYESYRMYLEGDSPHQTVMIMCELK